MSPGHFSASTCACSWGVSLSNGEPPLSPKPRRSKVSTLIPAVASCPARLSHTFRWRLLRRGTEGQQGCNQQPQNKAMANHGSPRAYFPRSIGNGQMAALFYCAVSFLISKLVITFWLVGKPLWTVHLVSAGPLHRLHSRAFLMPVGSCLRRPWILSMLFSALREAFGPRKGRSPLTSRFSQPDFQPENRADSGRSRKEGFMSDTPVRPADPARELPARANLEHLRNEAKQRLKTMRAHSPAVRLSEAQLLVARSYGFPSWRKLKSHVDALNDFGQQLINAVHVGDLETIQKVLDSHPEL